MTEPFFVSLNHTTVAINHRIIESFIGKGIYSMDVFTSLCTWIVVEHLLSSKKKKFLLLLLLALDDLNTLLGLSPEISPFYPITPSFAF